MDKSPLLRSRHDRRARARRTWKPIELGRPGVFDSGTSDGERVPGSARGAPASGGRPRAATTRIPAPTTRARRSSTGTISEPPKTLDPQVAYSTADHDITGAVYDTLLEYHYLDAPVPADPRARARRSRAASRGRTAASPTASPARRTCASTTIPCFALGAPGARRAQVDRPPTSRSRSCGIADPEVNSPVAQHLRARRRVRGLRRAARRAAQGRLRPSPRSRIDEQYARAGGIAGVRVARRDELEIVLSEPYPQILYWFAMEFTTPIPWEAVAYYDGEDGRDALRRASRRHGAVPARPSTTSGAASCSSGTRTGTASAHPEWRAPGATYPAEGEPDDAARGLLDPRLRRAGRCRSLDRVEFRLDKEDIPAFTKFLQGYYDVSGIIEESFDRVVHEGGLSPEMAALGMRLDKAVVPSRLLPRLQHGRPGGRRAGRRARPQAPPGDEPRDRQPASSCASSRTAAASRRSRRSRPASSATTQRYANPFRQVDLERARGAARARPAIPSGIDPADRAAAAPDLRHRRHERARPACATSSSSTPGAGSASTSRSPPPTTTSSRTRCAAAPTSSSCGAGSPTTPTRRTSSSCSGVRWRAQRAAARTPPTSPIPSTTRCSSRCATRPNGAGAARAHPRACTRSSSASGRGSSSSTPSRTRSSHGWLRNAKPLGMSFSTLKYHDVDPAPRARAAPRVERAGPAGRAYVLAALGVAVVAPGVVDAACGSGNDARLPRPPHRSTAPPPCSASCSSSSSSSSSTPRPRTSRARRSARRRRPRRSSSGSRTTATTSRSSGTPTTRRDTMLADHFRRMLTFDFGRSDADDAPITRAPRRGRSGRALAHRAALRARAPRRDRAGALRRVLPRHLRRPRRAWSLCVLAMSVSILLYIIGGQYSVGKLLRWFPISGFDPSPVGDRALPRAAACWSASLASSARRCASIAPCSSRRRARDYVARRARRARDGRVMGATCCATR